MNKSYQQNIDKKGLHLPEWICPNSNALSPLYKKIWEFVQEDDYKHSPLVNEILVDTNKVFPLLLTSHLSTEILGFIWNLANQKYSGRLTEQELYIVLALVALAQASYPFNSLQVLHLFESPPIPNLNFNLLDNHTSKNYSKEHVTSRPLISNSKKHGYINKANNKLNYPVLNHHEQKEVKLTSSQVSSFNETKFEESQKSYSQNEIKNNLSCPTNPADEFTEFQSAPMSTPNLTSILESRISCAIGSRLANHNLGVKKLPEKIEKVNVTKNSSTTQINSNSQETVVNDHFSDLFPKCTLKSDMKTIILKDTSIRNDDIIKINKAIATEENSERITSKINSAFKLTVKNNNHAEENKDLMNLQTVEDKYSALRELIEETSFPKPNNEISNVENSSTADDFGDFISAEPQTDSTKMIKNMNTFENSSLMSNLCIKPNILIDSTTEFNSTSCHENSDNFGALLFKDTLLNKKVEKSESSLYTDKINHKEDSISVNSIEISTMTADILPKSSSVPSLDLKSFLPTTQDDDMKIENMHKMIYREWKQYMESCVLILQVAVNIFNNITSQTVLREVLSSYQGYNFLCNLAEIAAICRRVNFSHREMDINIMGFDDLLMDIDRVWSEMEPYYTNIPIVTELPAWSLNPGDGETCSLCLTMVTNGKISYNGYYYHATCANFWLFTVNSNLPSLKYPTSFMQSGIVQNVNNL